MKPEGKLLIVDDDPDVLESMNLFLKYEFIQVDTIKNPNLIPGKISKENYDLVLLDMNFAAGIHSGNEGIFWLREILKIDPSIIVIPITAYGDIELAVKAIKEGATDFVVKPWDNDKLLSTLKTGLKLRYSRKEIESLKNKQRQLYEDIDQHYKMFRGSSPVMENVYSAITKVAGTNANILLTGENGTGKELIAREIHRNSDRNSEAFIAVDLGALNENIFESELFGHVRGAFTDAKEDRPGRLEIANGGTLFLDEISNVPIHLQSKLLTAIQQKQIVRIGSNEPVSLKVRIICATNKNLAELVTKNLFREDLLYRINTVEIRIPPLRERGEDILMLANHFLNVYTTKYEKPLLKMTSKAQDKLIAYNWPGNVRELRHTIEKAVIMSESDTLTPDDFFFTTPVIKEDNRTEIFNLAVLEKSAIEKALVKHSGNITKTARELGISRPTLYKKIEKYSIQI